MVNDLGSTFRGIHLHQMSRRLTKEEVIINFQNTHPFKNYNYSKINYINSHTKIEIICSDHGSFWQTPINHVNGSGCPSCSGNLKSNKKIFIEHSLIIHSCSNYDYTTVNYINSCTKVEIICKEHGSFFQRPNDHLLGNGCPSCAQYGFKPTEPAITYYFKDITTNLFKIGITNLTVGQRFGSKKLKEIQILKTWKFKRGEDAYKLEQSILTEHSEYRVNNDNFKGNGGTEFFSKDILGLEIKEVTNEVSPEKIR